MILIGVLIAVVSISMFATAAVILDGLRDIERRRRAIEIKMNELRWGSRT